MPENSTEQERQLVIIWDDMAQRIHAMEPALQIVFKQLDIDAKIQVNCEIPLLSRNGRIGKTPAIQVNDGDMWNHTYGQVITEEQFFTLFTHLKDIGVVK